MRRLPCLMMRTGPSRLLPAYRYQPISGHLASLRITSLKAGT